MISVASWRRTEKGSRSALNQRRRDRGKDRLSDRRNRGRSCGRGDRRPSGFNGKRSPRRKGNLRSLASEDQRQQIKRKKQRRLRAVQPGDQQNRKRVESPHKRGTDSGNRRRRAGADPLVNKLPLSEKRFTRNVEAFSKELPNRDFGDFQHV